MIDLCYSVTSFIVSIPYTRYRSIQSLVVLSSRSVNVQTKLSTINDDNNTNNNIDFSYNYFLPFFFGGGNFFWGGGKQSEGFNTLERSFDVYIHRRWNKGAATIPSLPSLWERGVSHATRSYSNGCEIRTVWCWQVVLGFAVWNRHSKLEKSLLISTWTLLSVFWRVKDFTVYVFTKKKISAVTLQLYKVNTEQLDETVCSDFAYIFLLVIIVIIIICFLVRY